MQIPHIGPYKIEGLLYPSCGYLTVASVPKNVATKCKPIRSIILHWPSSISKGKQLSNVALILAGLCSAFPKYVNTNQ